MTRLTDEQLKEVDSRIGCLIAKPGSIAPSCHEYTRALCDHELSDLIKELLSMRTENLNLKGLLKDICDEWSEACDVECDALAHTETCKSINIAQAKKDMRLKIESLEEKLAIAVKALQWVIRPEHDEPDDYTRLACAQYRAYEALKEIGVEK